MALEWAWAAPAPVHSVWVALPRALEYVEVGGPGCGGSREAHGSGVPGSWLSERPQALLESGGDREVLGAWRPGPASSMEGRSPLSPQCWEVVGGSGAAEVGLPQQKALSPRAAAGGSAAPWSTGPGLTCWPTCCHGRWERLKCPFLTDPAPCLGLVVCMGMTHNSVYHVW